MTSITLFSSSDFEVFIGMYGEGFCLDFGVDDACVGMFDASTKGRLKIEGEPKVIDVCPILGRPNERRMSIKGLESVTL